MSWYIQSVNNAKLKKKIIVIYANGRNGQRENEKCELWQRDILKEIYKKEESFVINGKRKERESLCAKSFVTYVMKEIYPYGLQHS